MAASISCAVIRTWSPDLRTEPSSTCATCSCRAISAIPISLPLNENDDVRAVTWSSRNLGEQVQQLLRDAVGEVLLVLVGAHVDERQHGDRALGRRGAAGTAASAAALSASPSPPASPPRVAKYPIPTTTMAAATPSQSPRREHRSVLPLR